MLRTEVERACTFGRFKRLQYFEGMLLTEQDFQDEQTYYREKLRLHNRLHGQGVVCGLDLKAKCIEVEGKSVWKIFIETGLALDCAGNEIVVCQPQRVDIETKIRELYQSCQTVDPLPTLCVGLTYCECKSDPEAQHVTDCIDNFLPRHFSRVREGYAVQVFTQDELPKCCKHDDCWPDDNDKGSKETCWELAGCCQAECCPVLVGCIKGYLSKDNWYTEIQNLDARSFTDAMIDRCCKPAYIDAYSSNQQWERQKQMALHTACKEFGWIDLSGIVGKSQDKATTCLEKSFPLSEISKITKITGMADLTSDERKALLTRINGAVSCVPSDSKIELIIDKDNCVLFALTASNSP